MSVGAPVSLGSLADPNDAASYDVTVTTPTAGRMVVVCIVNSRGSAATDPASVTGCGITFTKAAGQAFNTIASPTRHIAVWYGSTGSPSAGPITVGFGGVTQTSCGISVFEIDGVDTGSPLGQSVKANASDTLSTTASVSLDDLAAAGNGYIAAVGVSAVKSDVVHRTNWTEVHDQSISSPGSQIETQYRLGANDDASATWTTNARWGIIGIEWAEAGGGGGGGGLVTRKTLLGVGI